MISLAEAFDNHCHALAAANAHRLHAERFICRLQAVDERGHDARTCHAVWMAKGNRATIDVELLPRNAQVFGRRNHLRGECFINLNQIDVINRLVGTLESLPTGFYRP